MMGCGLLGKKLGHSYSPVIHSYFTDYDYDLFEVCPEDLESFLRKGAFTGLNVTIPYKKAVIPYCHTLSPTAQKLGAVNTIVRKEDGTLIGHNTDYFGFSSMLSLSGLKLDGQKVLVLGSGGASATVTAVLEEEGAIPVIISRSGDNNYGNLYLHYDAAAIVNTTPVGMYPDVGISPLNLDLFTQLQGVLDVIYNPSRTQLLMDAERKGLIALNGLWMLVAQAKQSAQWFTGASIPDARIGQVHKALRKTMENTVLIGMPGCGKSTVGRLLAEKTGKQFVDADAKIAELAGKSIPEIFAQHGESAFRDYETQVLAELGKCSGLVIATGGGCVTRQVNYPHLHQNGSIYWLQRDIGCLPTEGRPLSSAGKLEEMYRIRKPLYAYFADHLIDNSTTPEDAVQKIIQLEDA